MGLIIKNEKTRQRLLFLFDLSAFIMFLIFALMVHNFETNCCEAYQYVCPHPSNVVCVCYNISDDNNTTGHLITTTGTTVGNRITSR